MNALGKLLRYQWDRTVAVALVIGGLVAVVVAWVLASDTILTFGALDAASRRFATILGEHGVRPGDRVALIIPNVAYFPIAYYAILRCGAVVVPMNPLLKAGEIAYAWGDAGAKVAVVFALFAEEAAKAAEATGTDVFVVTPGEFVRTVAGAEPQDGG